MKNDLSLLATPEYRRFIADLKARVLSARISARRSVNHDGILLYWDIGRAIVEKQRVLGWGESVIDRVSRDLRLTFPESRGFSPRNLRDMKRFYLAYSDEAIWRQTVAKCAPDVKAPTGSIWPQLVAKSSGDQASSFLRQLVAEIPWGHHRFILDKLSNSAARLWYLQATARFGWTRNVLLN